MTANLDIAGAYGGGLSVRAQRQMESLRRDGWMLELERALLALNAPKDAGPARPDSGEERARAADARQEFNAGCDANASAVAHLARAASDSSAPQAVNAARRTQADEPAYEQTSDWLRKREGEMPSAAGTQYVPDVFGGGLMQQTNQPYPFPVLSPAPFQAREERSVPDMEKAQQIDMPARPATGTALRFTPMRGEASSEAAPRSEVMAQTSDEQQAADLLEEQQPYAQRKLHLYHGTDGVHAWIRDAGLAEFQARSIATALNGELSGSGLKLTALTLNGKKVADLFQDRPMQENGIPAAGNIDAVVMKSETKHMGDL